MKTSNRNKIALAVAGAVALAVAGAGVAGIKTTRHNLGTTGSYNVVQGAGSAGTGEICVFCHTPHGADTAASVPLWNRSLPASTSYTTYDQLGTSSLDGKVVQVGSVSIACLSCHDGSQAMDVMINEPGSGTDSAFDSTAAMSGTLSDGGTASDTMNSQFGITFIGTDLKNDHPIGIQYAGGGSVGTDANGQFSGNYDDRDFKKAYKGTVNNMPIWWVPTVTGGTVGAENGDGYVNASGALRSGTDYTTRYKTDMQLYTRVVASSATKPGAAWATADTTANAEPFVECASCHDPHSSNPTFLRVENVGSAVCLACHTK